MANLLGYLKNKDNDKLYLNEVSVLHKSINIQAGFTDLSPLNITCDRSGAATIVLHLLTSGSLSRLTISIKINGFSVSDNYYSLVANNTNLCLVHLAKVKKGDIISFSHVSGKFYGMAQYNYATVQIV